MLLTSSGEEMPLLKAYLVKEIQKFVSYATWNLIQSKGSMSDKAQKDIAFIIFHGAPAQGSNASSSNSSQGNNNSDPMNIPFIQQAIEGVSVFAHLYDKNDLERATGQSRLLGGSNSGPGRIRINKLLIPGADIALYVGNGPAADIRKEHLEQSNLSQRNTTLLLGRSILRTGKAVQATLRKVDAIAITLMNRDGTLPSGTNLESFLEALADKLVELKMAGKFNEDANVESDKAKNPADKVVQDGGAPEVAVATCEDRRKNWTYKMIPVTGWFSIALCVKNGIARKSLEDCFPLLKHGDYDKEEKKNHSRKAVRESNLYATARSRPGRRVDLATAGFDARDHIMASFLNIFADSNMSQTTNSMIEGKRDEVRFQEKMILMAQKQVDINMALGRDVSPLLENIETLMANLAQSQKELMEMNSEYSKRKANNDININQAQKVARMVQSSTVPGIVPHEINEAAMSGTVSRLDETEDSSQSINLQADQTFNTKLSPGIPLLVDQLSFTPSFHGHTQAPPSSPIPSPIWDTPQESRGIQQSQQTLIDTHGNGSISKQSSIKSVDKLSDPPAVIISTTSRRNEPSADLRRSLENARRVLEDAQKNCEIAFSNSDNEETEHGNNLLVELASSGKNN